MAASSGPVGYRALAGIRVVDMTTSYAGPTATMYLADLGAEVIKVERPPAGDDTRAWGPPFVGEWSAWFASVNRNKKSVVLDIKAPEGRQQLDSLLASAQVFITSMNPAKLEGLGLDAAAVQARHPALVYCTISGFGAEGPDAALPGYDLIAQARSGLMSVTGAKGGAPQRVSTALTDIVTGMSAAIAVLAAVRRLEHSGVGDVVEVSLLEAALSLMAPRLASYLAGEPEPAPSGGTDSVLAVYQGFDTADGRLVVAIGNDSIWQRFCSCTGLEHLGADDRMRTNEGRRAHQQEILDAIARVMNADTCRGWAERFAAGGIPCAPVRGLSDVVNDPQVGALGSIVTLPTDAGPVYGVRSPWRLKSDPSIPLVPPPALGEHSEAVLAELASYEETP
jgi:crotonobetainyl-CoA:carnitine CoA-transferase CaiB-like acyl-CoA transferase